MPQTDSKLPPYIKQDRQNTYDVTYSRILVTIVTVEKQ